MAETSLIVARFAVYATLLPAAGLPLYMVTGPRVATVTAALSRAIGAFAIAAMIASAWWAVASVAAMAALPIGELDRDTVMAVLGATPIGLALEVRIAALVVLAIAALFRLPRGIMVLAGLIAVATAAFTGHAGASEGGIGTVHRLADVVHLCAAACWIGALLTFAAGAFGRASVNDLEQGLARFAFTGSVIVALLVATGLVNTLAIAGWPLPWTSVWTELLLAKLALFAFMLGLAGLNRWRLTPALRAPDGSREARRRLRRSLLVETAAGFTVLALVGVLGVLDPSGAAV